MPDLPPPEHGATVATLREAGCVFAEEEADLLLEAARTPAELARLVGRRAAGEPLEHLLGWAAFGGMRIRLEPGVFVPRTRTEVLAETAARLLAESHRDPPVLLDLCCGAGPVAALASAAVPGARVWAVDTDAAAVRSARGNLGPEARVLQGDLFGPLPATLTGGIDVVAANVPYVPTAALALMPPEARDHEARLALDGGPDGLDVLRRVAEEVPAWLVPGGHLLTEVATAQVTTASALLSASGLVPSVLEDRERFATVLVGRLAGRLPAPRRGSAGPG